MKRKGVTFDKRSSYETATDNERLRGNEVFRKYYKYTRKMVKELMEKKDEQERAKTVSGPKQGD